MNHRSEEQLAAIRRFETDYFPALEQGIVSKDITTAMRHDWATLLAPPEIPLAGAVTEPASEVPLGNSPVHLDELEAAVTFVGIRDVPTVRETDPPPFPTPKGGKGRAK